jgi:outer membrane biosynthesis protein TonB
MARKLDDIFNECYERIRLGESLESCLRRYPEHRAELESLLITAFDVGRRASYIHPRPAFKHWAQVRVEAARYHARQPQRQIERAETFSRWRQGWAVALAAVLILILTSSGTMAASAASLPDQPLYQVKLVTEQVRLALAFTDAQKAQVQTQIVGTRAAEVQALANQGKTEQAAIAAERLADQLELADSAIEMAERIKAEGSLPPPPESPAVPPASTVEQPVPPPPAEPPAVPTVATGEQPTESATPPPAESLTVPTVSTGEQPTESATPPASTEEEQPTTSAATTGGKTSATTKHLKKSLDNSTSKSLEALKKAMENASPDTKSDWQKAIDTISKKSYSQPTAQSDNTTGKEVKPKYNKRGR